MPLPLHPRAKKLIILSKQSAIPVRDHVSLESQNQSFYKEVMQTRYSPNAFASFRRARSSMRLI